ncbi:unnamed protein product [Pylaiella littoralis]
MVEKTIFVALLLLVHGQLVVSPPAPAPAPVGRPKRKKSRPGSAKTSPPTHAEKERKSKINSGGRGRGGRVTLLSEAVVLQGVMPVAAAAAAAAAAAVAREEAAAEVVVAAVAAVAMRVRCPNQPVAAAAAAVACNVRPHRCGSRVKASRRGYEGQDFRERPNSRHTQLFCRRPVGVPSEPDHAQDVGLGRFPPPCLFGSVSRRLHNFPEGRQPCPRCKTTSHVIAKRFTQKESRRAVLRDSCCDLLGFLHHCHGCESKNQGKPKNSKVPESFPIRDAGVMAQLSLFVRENFPFVLTHRSAAHMCVMEDVTYNLVHGKGFGASRTALEQAHRKEFHAIDLISVAESKSASTIGHIGETLLQWVCPFGTLPFIGVDRRNADQTGGQERQASPRSGGRVGRGSTSSTCANNAWMGEC